MNIKWFIVIYLVLGAVAKTALVGRPQKPITPGIAAGHIVIVALIVAGIFAWWD